MYRWCLVNTLATHANTKGFGLSSLSVVRHGFMPPQLKTKQELCLTQQKTEGNKRLLKTLCTHSVMYVTKICTKYSKH